MNSDNGAVFEKLDAWCSQRPSPDRPAPGERFELLKPLEGDQVEESDDLEPAQQWLRDREALGPGGPLPGRKREVAITPEEHAVVEAVAEALMADEDLYYQGSRLVRVVGEGGESTGMFSDPGGLRVEALPSASIRTAITRVARLTRTENRSSWAVHPPEWLGRAIRGRGRWDATPGARRLLGVVEVPTLRPDGTPLQTPGYDRASHLLYAPAGTPRALLKAPDQGDAIEAASRLMRLTDEFPYHTPADQSTWLALVLTLAGRYAIDGPTPLVWFDASDRGCGKTTLAELAGLIATGRIPPSRHLPTTPEEWPKTLLAIARSAVRLVLFDNARNGSTIGDSAFDSALTATSVAGRLLGTMEDLTPMPLACSWTLTGNNLTLDGDLIRRVIRCRLVSREERPELVFGGYRLPDILAHTRAHRHEFLRDALTLLHAHALAGRPGHGEPRLGRFEAWDDVVRAAIIWVGLPDPVATLTPIREEDEKLAREAVLIEGWAELPDAFGSGHTVKEMLACLRQDPCTFPCLAEAISPYLGKSDRETAQRVGDAIRHARDKNRGGYRLVLGKLYLGSKRWRVELT